MKVLFAKKMNVQVKATWKFQGASDQGERE